MIYSGLVDHLKKLAGITQKEEKSSDDDDSDPDGIKSAPEVGQFHNETLNAHSSLLT